MNKKDVLKRNIIIFISMIIIIFFKLIPAPMGLNQSSMQVLGIFIGVLILWLTIAIDWPSLLCLAALGFVPELSFNEVLSTSIGGSTFSFLIFTFMCTYALSKTSFVKKIALAFVNSKIAKRGPWHFTILFLSSALLLGMIMSPTVLFVIYLPIIEEIYRVLELKRTDKFANMLMMGMTFSMSIATGMTPIAHVFAIMAMGFYETATGLTIGYGEYMSFAIPVGIILFILMILMFKLILKPDTSVFKVGEGSLIEDDTKPLVLEEKLVIAIFGIVIFLWVGPDLLKYITPDFAAYIKKFGTALPPLLGAVAMMIITVDGKPLLDYKEAMSKGVSWSAVIMAASTLAIGSALTHPEVGITGYLSDVMAPVFEGLSPIVIVLIITTWAGVQTNLSSNMVTVTVVSAVALPVAIASNGVISTGTVASIIGMMASLAYATPPAHPNVAIAGSSGWSNTKQMMLYGTILLILSILVTTFVGYPIGMSVMK